MRGWPACGQQMYVVANNVNIRVSSREFAAAAGCDVICKGYVRPRGIKSIFAQYVQTTSEHLRLMRCEVVLLKTFE